VIGGRPRVRAVGHASIRELVEHALVGVGFGAEEDEVLEAVGQSVVGVVPRRRRPPPPGGGGGRRAGAAAPPAPPRPPRRRPPPPPPRGTRSRGRCGGSISARR
jgi:hypothetical protein